MFGGDNHSERRQQKIEMRLRSKCKQDARTAFT